MEKKKLLFPLKGEMMKIKIYISIIIISLSMSSFVYASNDKVNQKFDLNEIKQLSTQEVEKHSQFINKLFSDKKNSSKANNVKKADGAILFVSFSMPDNLLIELSEQANKYNIPLVIKGLVNNDFKETFRKIQEVKTKATANHRDFHGVSIDPIWFEQFDIKKVPALVLTQRGGECELQKVCHNQAYDVVYGNSPVKNSLQQISNSDSKFSNLAKKLLEGSYDE